MRLQDSLLLFRYVTDLLGGDFHALRNALRDADHGRRADGQSHYFSVLESRASRLSLDLESLRRYDLNILAYEARLARYRTDFSLKFFQYLAALYTEVYLDRLSADRTELAVALDNLRARAYPHLPPMRSADLSKLAFWMATGSGKTLLVHVNLMQFEHYRPFEPVNVLLLTPSPALAEQHLNDLEASGISACHARDAYAGHRGVQVLEITKLYVA